MLPAKPEPVPLRPYNDRALNALIRPQLTLFSGEREFAGYLRWLEAIKQKREDIRLTRKTDPRPQAPSQCR